MKLPKKCGQNGKKWVGQWKKRLDRMKEKGWIE